MSSVNLIVGSQMGSAEYVAEQLSDALNNLGITTQLHDQPEFSDIDQQNTIWLICTSTYGAGDYPENFISFVEDVTQANDLSELKYSVIALGDTSYDTYCHGSIQIENIMLNTGATLSSPALHIDVLNHPIPEDVAVKWLNNWLKTNEQPA